MLPPIQWGTVPDWCASMTKEQLDMAILGQIMASLNMEDTVGGRSKHTVVARQRTRLVFFHLGKKICRKTFTMLHGIGMFYLQM